MNKKLIYIFAVLVAGLFVISACQEAVGVPARQLERGGAGTSIKTLVIGATNEYSGVKLVSVSPSNPEACVVEYRGLSYSIKKGTVKTMADGIIVSVTKLGSTTDNNLGSLDYCEIGIRG